MNLFETTTPRILLVLAAAGLLALPGCDGPGYDGGSDPFDGTGNGNNTGDDDDDDDVNTQQTALTGVVRDAMGQPVSGATVQAAGASATTDQNGRFFIADMVAADRVSVNVTKPGFAKNSTPIEILDEIENMVLVTLAEVDYESSFDAAAGHTFEIEIGGPTVSLPAGGFVDADGNPYAGTVNVEATFYDLESDWSDVEAGNEINATPGDFTAIDANGEFQTLESFGMFQVNLTDPAGNELNLANSAGAPVVLPLQSLTPEAYAVGDTIPMWSYDEVTGRWMEEGVGTVFDNNGVLSVQFEAPHFSTWNCDQPLPTHGCVTGTINTGDGQSRAGATVRAVGITYISTTTARTTQNGDFCLEVKNGEQVWLEISYSVNGQMATTRSQPVTIPSGQGTCTQGGGTNCVDIGEIDMEIMTCLSGVVVTSQGQPVANAVVAASSGGTSETDANGFFCIATPVFFNNTVSVVEGQLGNQLGFIPVQIYAQPGMPACQSGCPNVVVLRPYSGTACAWGELWFGNEPGANQVIEVYDQAFPETRIVATVVEQNGSFCVPVPTGVDVTVQSNAGPGGFCDAVDVSSAQTGQVSGGTCDGSGQSGECVDVGPLSCTGPQ
jgi:hypothetical protein